MGTLELPARDASGGTTPRGNEARARPGTLEAMRRTQRMRCAPPTCVGFAHRAMMAVICAKPESVAEGVVGCMIRRHQGPLIAA